MSSPPATYPLKRLFFTSTLSEELQNRLTSLLLPSRPMYAASVFSTLLRTGMSYLIVRRQDDKSRELLFKRPGDFGRDCRSTDSSASAGTDRGSRSACLPSITTHLSPISLPGSPDASKPGLLRNDQSRRDRASRKILPSGDEPALNVTAAGGFG